MPSFIHSVLITVVECVLVQIDMYTVYVMYVYNNNNMYWYIYGIQYIIIIIIEGLSLYIQYILYTIYSLDIVH